MLLDVMSDAMWCFDTVGCEVMGCDAMWLRDVVNGEVMCRDAKSP